MSYLQASRTLKATADPTRLRLLTLLDCGEASVGELQAILGQSQPRVSRHLRLLTEAGLVERFRDGHWVYYRVAPDPAVRAMVQAVIATVDHNDPQRREDLGALDVVKRQRQRDAYADRPTLPALLAGGAARPPAAELREVLEEALGDRAYGDVLDIGCGGGALLPLLAPRARLVVGADISRAARVLARSRAHEGGLRNCTIRAADLRQLPFADDRFDLVILDEVLASLGDELTESLGEALRVLRPTGCLLILDHIGPVASRLRQDLHAGLVDNHLTTALAAAGARVTGRRWLPGRAPDYALFAATPVYATQRTGSDD